MTVTVELRGAKRLKDWLKDLRNEQFPYASARALTDTAADARAALKDEIRRVFDRPTRWTENAIRMKGATKTDLRSLVAIKDKVSSGTPQAAYLMHHVRGGQRPDKAHANRLQSAGKMPSNRQAVPGRNARLNTRGNMTRASIVKAVEKVDEPGSAFFTRYANGKPVGISERLATKTKSVIAFVRPGTYERSFEFHRVGKAKAHEVFPKHFHAWYEKALATRK